MTLLADELVTAADRVLHPPTGSPDTLAPGVRARAAAILLRMALDQAMDAYWCDITPAMTQIAKHRMLCLEWYADRDTARRWRTTWTALSVACHYRSYELPPRPAEIQGRLREVTDLLQALPPRPRVGAV